MGLTILLAIHAVWHKCSIRGGRSRTEQEKKAKIRELNAGHTRCLNSLRKLRTSLPPQRHRSNERYQHDKGSIAWFIAPSALRNRRPFRRRNAARQGTSPREQR